MIYIKSSKKLDQKKAQKIFKDLGATNIDEIDFKKLGVLFFLDENKILSFYGINTTEGQNIIKHFPELNID